MVVTRALDCEFNLLDHLDLKKRRILTAVTEQSVPLGYRLESIPTPANFTPPNFTLRAQLFISFCILASAGNLNCTTRAIRDENINCFITS